jgi:hypothetical protein
VTAELEIVRCAEVVGRDTSAWARGRVCGAVYGNLAPRNFKLLPEAIIKTERTSDLSQSSPKDEWTKDRNHLGTHNKSRERARALGAFESWKKASRALPRFARFAHLQTSQGASAICATAECTCSIGARKQAWPFAQAGRRCRNVLARAVRLASDLSGCGAFCIWCLTLAAGMWLAIAPRASERTICWNGKELRLAC